MNKHYKEFKQSFKHAVNINQEVESLTKELQAINVRVAVGSAVSRSRLQP